MSKFYTPRRIKNLYDPASKAPFRLSRSKIDLFLNCARCFYLDRRLGVGQPPGFPFTLNSAVDALLKKEFDGHRAKGSKHPLCERYGVDAVPLSDPRMNEWRDALRGGIVYHHEPSGFLVTGGVDDVWVNSAGELIIVDYKATSKDSEVNLDADWQIGYKRQMEVYQWLFRQNGFKVSRVGYFVYCNGDADKEAFDAKLEFDVHLLPYEGDDGWVSDTLMRAKECLVNNAPPPPGSACDFCSYRRAVHEVVADHAQRFALKPKGA